MIIRTADLTDIAKIVDLFYSTVTGININDYTPGQIKVWAAGASDFEKWKKKIEDEYFIVAESGAELLGFASIDETGYIDYLYVAKDYLRKGIATMLLQNIEDYALEKHVFELHGDVSITAKPFFEKRGYIVRSEHTKYIEGTEFLIYQMIKIFMNRV